AGPGVRAARPADPRARVPGSAGPPLLRGGGLRRARRQQGEARAVKRSGLLNVAKLAIAGGLGWWVIHKVGWDNLTTSLASIHVGTWMLGLATIFIGTIVSVVRWYVLMRSVGLRTSMWTVFRLSWIG